MRITVATLLVVAVVGHTSCGGSPTAPSPAPSPTPTPYPMGKANATAFENLPLARQLEHASGRQTVFVYLSGSAVTQQGLCSPGNSWSYIFGQLRDNIVKLYGWSVRCDGTVKFHGEIPDALHFQIKELGPSLLIDSPEAVRLGRQYGAQRFVDKFPGALVKLIGRFMYGLPAWEAEFFDLSTRCNVPILFRADTGEFLSRDLTCLNQLPLR